MDFSESDLVVSLGRDLHQLLFYHQQLGITHYPSSRVLQQFLALQPEVIKTCDTISKKLLPQEGASAAKSSSSNKRSGPSAAERGENIPGARLRQGMGINGGRLAEGNARIRLLLIGDWARKGDDEKEAGLLFGRQEDEMVRKMVAALYLPASEVYLINAIDAAPSPSLKITPEYISRYTAPLFQHIEQLDPQYICAMGPIAAKVLLESKLALSLLRGKLHFREIGGVRRPVLVTYHPHYLLQNQEMKRPTWQDLQFLGRQMGLLA